MESWKSYENGGNAEGSAPTTQQPQSSNNNTSGSSPSDSNSSRDDNKSPNNEATTSSIASTSVAAAAKTTTAAATAESTNSSGSQTTTTPSVGPDPAKLKAILDRTHYAHQVTAGQRKYGGPPPEWIGTTPPAGSEIFVGHIPKDVFEDELIPIFEKIGRLWDLRLMVDPVSSNSRGYAFITYTNKEDAHRAVKELDGYKIQHKNVNLKVNISVPNLRLFIGNIPKIMSKEQIFNEFNKITEGLAEVITYSPPEDHKKNRGFCFLEYDSHKNASAAKRKLTSSGMKIFKCDILVDWADPQEEPDEETMSKVKVLYVRNLTSQVSEQQLKTLFEEYGPIDRVKKIKDYAFVHFDERDKALRAMEELNGVEVGGSNIEISLAKPPSDRRKKEEMLRNRERRMFLMLQQKQLMSFPRSSSIPLRPPMPPVAPIVAPSSMQPMGRSRNRYSQPPMNSIPQVSPYGRQGQNWMPMPPYYQDPNEYWFSGNRSGGPSAQSGYPYGSMQTQAAHAAALAAAAAAQWGFHLPNAPNGQQMPSVPFGGTGNSPSGGGSGSNRRNPNSNQMPGAGNLSGAALVGLNGNLGGISLANLQQQPPPPHMRKWRKSNGGPSRSK